jgi:hypothetical protein
VVREAVVQGTADWLELLVRQMLTAQEAGEPDAEQLAFEIDAIGSPTNLRVQPTGVEQVFDRAAAAIESRLSAAARNQPSGRS